MSEDSTDGARPGEHDPIILLYDFYKFLTTLAVLVMGGVLSLASSEVGISARSMVIVVVLLSISGVTALSGADGVVRSRVRGRPVSRWTRLLQGLSMGCLGAGTGAFLSMWLERLQ